jgi:hypothetical protein
MVVSSVMLGLVGWVALAKISQNIKMQNFVCNCNVMSHMQIYNAKYSSVRMSDYRACKGDLFGCILPLLSV